MMCRICSVEHTFLLGICTCLCPFGGTLHPALNMIPLITDIVLFKRSQFSWHISTRFPATPGRNLISEDSIRVAFFPYKPSQHHRRPAFLFSVVAPQPRVATCLNPASLAIGALVKGFHKFRQPAMHVPHEIFSIVAI
ncbi:hypothetical protein BT69DRAFT_924867 [Atractiella rhizophila]|nr:hypothetical protein BT69DRAFT_924867 [Atractiella rhizophila]